MLLITGLGNPGKEYEKTPHNAGFLCLESLKRNLSEKGYQVSDWENEEKLFNSQISKVKEGGELICILQKPLTYMNKSGMAVKTIVEKFGVNQFVLLHDDLDIQLGKYKIQREKSPKGHNGVLSVEEALGSTDFWRVRIGIESRNGKNIPGEEYVIRKYSKKEYEELLFVVETAAQELLSTIFPLK